MAPDDGNTIGRCREMIITICREREKKRTKKRKKKKKKGNRKKKKKGKKKEEKKEGKKKKEKKRGKRRKKTKKKRRRVQFCRPQGKQEAKRARKKKNPESGGIHYRGDGPAEGNKDLRVAHRASRLRVGARLCAKNYPGVARLEVKTAKNGCGRNHAAGGRTNGQNDSCTVPPGPHPAHQRHKQVGPRTRIFGVWGSIDNCPLGAPCGPNCSTAWRSSLFYTPAGLALLSA